MLDLALGAGQPPRSLAELIERTRPGVTAALYERDGTERSLALKAEASSFSTTQWNSVSFSTRGDFRVPPVFKVGLTTDSDPRT